jgi:AraC-like DNA-binding protein
MAPKRPRSPTIHDVPYGNARRPELPLEVMSLAALRRMAPPGYLARPLRPAFHQLLLPARGRWLHEVDFCRVTLTPGTLAWTRPGQVQRFELDRGVEGWLVLFTPDALDSELDAPLGPRVDLGPAAGDVAWLVERLRRFSEDLGADLGSTRTLLRHLLHALLVLLRRAAAADHDLVPVADGSVFALFRAEVERRFAKTREVQAYARFIGYSPKTLSRATQAAVGLSAKAYVDQRVVLESRRLLAHTDLSTSEIGARVGFSETTNFIKFFRREARESPSVFRARSRA